MKQLKTRLDPKYTKICLYAGVTVLLTFLGILLILHSGSVISKALEILRAILQPLIFGGILCYLFSPPVAAMQKRLPKQSRKLAVLLFLLGVALVLIVLAVLAVFAMTRQFKKIDFSELKTLFLSMQTEFSSFAAVLQEKLNELNLPIGNLGSRVVDLVGDVKTAVTTAVFSVIFSIYFLLDGSRISAYWNRVLDAVAGEAVRARLGRLLADADQCFSGYLRGQVIDAAIVGLLVSAAMTIAGVPYGIVVGILTGLGNLIPYVGTLVGFLSLAVACLAGGAVKKLLIGGGALGGFAGMLVAVPAAAFLKLQLDRYVEQKEENRANGAFQNQTIIKEKST